MYLHAYYVFMTLNCCTSLLYPLSNSSSFSLSQVVLLIEYPYHYCERDSPISEGLFCHFHVLKVCHLYFTFTMVFTVSLNTSFWNILLKLFTNFWATSLGIQFHRAFWWNSWWFSFFTSIHMCSWIQGKSLHLLQWVLHGEWGNFFCADSCSVLCNFEVH